MSFIPPGEKIVETKTCQISGEEFVVTDKDVEFYDKVSPVFNGKKYSIPSPKLCPDERQRRRLLFRNFTNLYHRKSDLSEKQIISMYHKDATFPVYEISEWWSDDWNPLDYGINVGKYKHVFEYIKELHRTVPRMSITNVNCENSGYCNLAFKSKDCYLVFGCVESEECLYGHIVWKSKNCIDGVYNYTSEDLYQCVDCAESKRLFFSNQCNNCSDSYFLRYCDNCRDCFGCSGLKNKQYYIYNQPHSREEYFDKLASLNLQNTSIQDIVQKQTIELQKDAIVKNYHGIQVENCTGDYLYYCKNSHHCYDAKNCENTKYCYTVESYSNSQDCTFSPAKSDFMYNNISGHGNNILMSHNVTDASRNIIYCDNCYACSDCFGCVGLRRQQYCIFNKQYTKEEYETICAQLIESMQIDDTWGDYFPADISAFAYNESIVQQYYPLNKEEAEDAGYVWRDEDETQSYHGTAYEPIERDNYLPEKVGQEIASKHISELLNSVFVCTKTGAPFKIIEPELKFLLSNNLAFPQTSWQERYRENMLKRNPRKLWSRICNTCKKDIQTTFSPDREEKVCCEECYVRNSF